MEKTCRPLIDVWVEAAKKLGDDLTLHEGETLGWKSVYPDLTTRDGFRWPFPGGIVTATAPTEHDDPCPQHSGDGLCIAKNAAGARSGGIRLGTVLLVAWSGLLAESDDKLRVRSARALSVVDAHRADLSGADLSRADLSGADLTGADLSRADLSRADLSRAFLSGADLSRADLSRAYLSRAFLSGANLSGAYLAGAFLTGADLSGADLSGAYLAGAYLSGADLTGAYLSGAACGRVKNGDLVR